MKKIFINDDNLEINDLDYEVIRVKGFVVNSKDEILIAFNNNTYQFPGGHVEFNENKEAALSRELKEELGINIGSVSEPFMEIVTYAKRYFGTDKNVCNRIFYYRILCDESPNLDETDYDELERQTEFRLFYVRMDELADFLNNCLVNGTIDVDIGREMLLALEEYNYLFGSIL